MPRSFRHLLNTFVHCDTFPHLSMYYVRLWSVWTTRQRKENALDKFSVMLLLLLLRLNCNKIHKLADFAADFLRQNFISLFLWIVSYTALHTHTCIRTLLNIYDNCWVFGRLFRLFAWISERRVACYWALHCCSV